MIYFNYFVAKILGKFSLKEIGTRRNVTEILPIQHKIPKSISKFRMHLTRLSEGIVNVSSHIFLIKTCLKKETKEIPTTFYKTLGIINAYFQRNYFLLREHF